MSFIFIDYSFFSTQIHGQNGKKTRNSSKHQSNTFTNNVIDTTISSSFEKDLTNQLIILPPYLKKRNRRFKMIHELMHQNGSKSSSPYGYMEFQKKLCRENEFPGEKVSDSFNNKINRILTPSFIVNSLMNDRAKQNHKFKKRRFKPETGIMQKFKTKNL